MGKDGDRRQRTASRSSGIPKRIKHIPWDYPLALRYLTEQTSEFVLSAWPIRRQLNQQKVS
jgi:hypothetical protein